MNTKGVPLENFWIKRSPSPEYKRSPQRARSPMNPSESYVISSRSGLERQRIDLFSPPRIHFDRLGLERIDDRAKKFPGTNRRFTPNGRTLSTGHSEFQATHKQNYVIKKPISPHQNVNTSQFELLNYRERHNIDVYTPFNITRY